MIPQEYIQEVVRRNDIEDIVGQYVQLRRRGRTLTGLCPFHNEKTPSFVVYPDTQSFYCFGCGAAGDVISFVRKYNNLGYVETVKQLASRAGMPLPEEDDDLLVREKVIDVAPMTEEQALVQTDLLGHDFYVFENATTGLINVVYHRKNGGYGIIKPRIETLDE